MATLLYLSVFLNVGLGALALYFRSETPRRDKSGRFKSKSKSKKSIPDFFKDLTGDSQ